MEEGGEHGADLSIVAAVGVEEEADDGIENQELDVGKVVDRAVEVGVLPEVEKDLRVGRTSGGVAAVVEDADVFEVRAGGDEAGADDLIWVVFARAEEDGALRTWGTAGAGRVVGPGETCGNSSGNVVGEERLSYAGV
jgi:hypothetical protein